MQKYQYGLLMIMTKLVFANVAGMPDYSFDVPMFFVTFAAFVVAYGMSVMFTPIRSVKRP